MKLIVIAVFALIGGAVGYAVPYAARKQIEYKLAGSRESDFTDRFTGIVTFYAKVISSAVTALGLAVCAYFEPPVHLLFLTVPIWFIGTVTVWVDIAIRIIADGSVIALSLLGITLRCLTSGFTGLLNSLITAAFVAAVWLVAYRLGGRGAVGGGDIKLSCAIALIFGYPTVTVAVAVTAVTVLSYIAFGLLTRRLKLHDCFPMGPFLSAGMLAALPYMLATL